jgi:hypothetical protein
VVSQSGRVKGEKREGERRKKSAVYMYTTLSQLVATYVSFVGPVGSDHQMDIKRFIASTLKAELLQGKYDLALVVIS